MLFSTSDGSKYKIPFFSTLLFAIAMLVILVFTIIRMKQKASRNCKDAEENELLNRSSKTGRYTC